MMLPVCAESGERGKAEWSKEGARNEGAEEQDAQVQVAVKGQSRKGKSC